MLLFASVAVTLSSLSSSFAFDYASWYSTVTITFYITVNSTAGKVRSFEAVDGGFFAYRSCRCLEAREEEL